MKDESRQEWRSSGSAVLIHPSSFSSTRRERFFLELLFIEVGIELHIAEVVGAEEVALLVLLDRADLQPGFNVEVERHLGNAFRVGLGRGAVDRVAGTIAG